MPDRVSLGRVHHRRDCQGVKPGPGGSAGVVGGATNTSTTSSVLSGDLTIQSYIDRCGVGGFVCSCFVNGNRGEMRNIAEYGILKYFHFITLV